MCDAKVTLDSVERGADPTSPKEEAHEAILRRALAFPLEPVVQRYCQDIHVITQHMQARLAHYELIGRYWLGLKVDEARF